MNVVFRSIIAQYKKDVLAAVREEVGLEALLRGEGGPHTARVEESKAFEDHRMEIIDL